MSQFGLSHLFVLEMPPFYVSPECIQAETTSALFLSSYNCLLIVSYSMQFSYSSLVPSKFDSSEEEKLSEDNSVLS